MKKNICSIVISLSLLLMAVSASSAEDAMRIPTSWSNELQASTRSVIQAGLETDNSILMTRAMIKAQFEERHIVQAQQIVAGTLEKGLPVDPVMNKAYEGMTKRVPAASVVQAMERVQSRYEFAYALTGQLSQKKEVKERLGYDLTAGLAAGLSRKDAEQLVSQLQGKAREMEQAKLMNLASECLLTTRDMARQGVSSATATEVVSQAIKKEFNVQQMRSLRSTFMSQGVQGSRESLAKGYANAIQEGKDLQNSTGRSGGRTDAGNNGGAGGSGSGGDGSSGDSGGDGGSGGGGDGGSGDSGGDGGSGGGGDGGSGDSGGDGGSGSGGDGGSGGSGGDGGGSGGGSSGSGGNGGSSGNGSGN